MEGTPVPLKTVYPEGGDVGNIALGVSHTAPHSTAGGDCSPANDLEWNLPSHDRIPTRDCTVRRGAHEGEGLTENAAHCQVHCCHRPSTNNYHQIDAEEPNNYDQNPQPIACRPEPLANIHERPGSVQHSSEHHLEPVCRPQDQASGYNDRHADYQGAPRHCRQNIEVDMRPGNMHTTSTEQPLQKASATQTSLAMNINQSPLISSEHQLPCPHHSEKDEGTTLSLQRRYDMNESSQTDLTPQPKPQCVAPPLVPEMTVVPSSQMHKLTLKDAENHQVFYPGSMTHLSFKEKQLALSAVQKAASNMSCVKMFQEKDKFNTGIIGRRDFQIIMDRVGVLNGMSSREIDAVFKGFSVNKETELDYKRFTAACRQAIDSDHRLSRMAQK